jgi:hypothetical protein
MNIKTKRFGKKKNNYYYIVYIIIMADYNKNFLNNKYYTKDEKEKLINNIIKDFQDYQNTLNDLKSIRRELEAIKKAVKYEADKDKNNNYDDMLLKNDSYKKLKPQLKELEKLWKKIRLNYKIALIQRKNIYNNVCKNICEYKKAKNIIVLKAQYIGAIINRIQISIIFVSSTITLFESLQGNFVIDAVYLTLIPIVLSSYIAIVLAISRFYKFDTKKENITKVEEKYSYIINRLRYKRRKVLNFDFACEKLDKWSDLIENFNKDGLEEMITKTIEESDSLLTLKEHTYYHKVYNKIKTKNSIHQFNSNLLEDWQKQDSFTGNIRINNGPNVVSSEDIPENIYNKKCICYKICRIFNCCKTTFIDYDTFFNLLERNYQQKQNLESRVQRMEEDEEDYQDYLEHDRPEKETSPVTTWSGQYRTSNGPPRGPPSRGPPSRGPPSRGPPPRGPPSRGPPPRGSFGRTFSGFFGRKGNDTDSPRTSDSEDEKRAEIKDSSNNNQLIVSIKRRSSSTGTDYESDQEY